VPRSSHWSLHLFVCAALLLSTSVVHAGPAYPLKVGPTGRYLVDQNGVPFLIAGESPQGMIGDLTDADATLFFANRQAHGFNTVWINLLCASYTGCNADGTTFDGIAPFTVERDLSTPNAAYFARADRILRLAAQYGFLVILDPAETGSWLGVLESNGVDKAREYGRFLGSRYASFDNILWMHGNDFGDWTVPAADQVVQAVARGIQDRDTRHLHTVEFWRPSTSLDDPTWAPLIQLNAAYTHILTYPGVLEAYNHPGFLPTFMVEALYEYSGATALILRQQEYWSILSGAAGQLYGNYYTSLFPPGWQTYLTSPGAVQFSHLMTLLEARPWYDLVPDQTHALVTSGYGTFGDIGYVTAARTPGGELAFAYVPSARTITVNMSMMSGAVSARWYDPAAGTFLAIPGSPFQNSGGLGFTTPGNNADGDEDWVLVLEAVGVPAPTLSSISPSQVNVGGPDFTLTANGTHFDQTSVVRINSNDRPTTFVSAAKLTATIGAADIAVAGTLSVTVLTPGALASNSLTLSVRNPAPSLAAIAPTRTLMGGAGFTLTVTGNNFGASSVVKWKGLPRATTFVSPTELTIDVSANDLATAGTAAVTVFNPSPGGGTSAAATFTIDAPGRVAFASATAAVDETAPSVTLVVTRTAGVGGPVTVDFATADGTAVAGVDYDATAGTFTFAIGDTSKTIVVPVHFTPAGGNKTFTVTLSNPSGLLLGTPSVNTVTVRNVTSTLTAFTPTQGPVGTLVTITGTNLQLATAVAFNGLGTSSFTLLSPTAIRVAVPAGATTGPIGVTSPAGSPISAGIFKVVPKITGLSPDSGLVGSSVTISGRSLTGATAVRFGSVLATSVSFDDDNTITATVPATAVTGPVSVSTPGGTATSPAPFVVIKAPTITSFSPTVAPEATPVTLSGANLGSVTGVSFNGVDASPVTILSATAIRAMVPLAATTGRLGAVNPAGTVTSLMDFKVAPRILTVTPSQATPGTPVTITGTTLTGATAVKFGAVLATAFAVSGDGLSITATVPTTASTGRIMVTTPAATATSPADFTVIRPPTITSFTPTAGPIGTTITISGTNLGSVTTLTINGTASSVTVRSPTSLRALVPPAATTGPLGAVNDAGSTQSAASFAVTPTVGVFAPTRGVPGTPVAISGTTFTGATAVKFGTVAATILSVEDTQITTTVPATAVSGPVSVTTPAGTTMSAATFTVVRTPIITGVSPARSPVGTTVTLSGANLGTVTAVDVNGLDVGAITVLSASSVGVVVPDGATTGRIHASNEAGTATSPTDFVLMPRLLDMTPGRALPGSTVTLTGRNLSGMITVRFGAVAATFIPVDDTQITTTVPATAATGKISVTTPAGAATSATDFVVIRPPTITSFTPATGPEGTLVTLAGANLASVNQVTFNGAAVTAITVLSPGSLRVAVPAGATSGKISVANEATPGGSLSVASFVVTPRITQIPAAAQPGTAVTITGTSFTNASAVRFAGVTATFNVDDPTQITATVPLTAATGKISVTTPGGTATSPTDLTVIRPPVVTSFTPTSGQVAILVDINGTNLGSATNVIFGGNVSAAAMTVLSTASIRVPVPVGALTGRLTVTNPAGSAQSAGTFVTAPRITGFGAPSGPADSAVTLLGSSFTGATAVKFGTTSATFTFVSDAEITAMVPAAAVTGRVSVTTSGGTATSPTDFVITAP
jgi:Protein of unknown function (DUF4038)/Calx-beta domain/Putative collagen-binding domain of a collagenase/IPT/TIG domain